MSRRRTARTPLSVQILLALADRARYGYDIIQEIERQTDGAMSPKTGSLYAALQRLADEGLIEEMPEAADEGEDERRRYFGLSVEGREAARGEALRMARALRVAGEKDLLGALSLSLPEAGEA